MKSFREFIAEKEGGSNIDPEVAKRVIADFRKTQEIPDRPKPEEKAIYTKLEELMSDIYYSSDYGKGDDDSVDDVDGWNRAAEEVADMPDRKLLSVILGK